MTSILLFILLIIVVIVTFMIIKQNESELGSRAEDILLEQARVLELQAELEQAEAREQEQLDALRVKMQILEKENAKNVLTLEKELAAAGLKGKAAQDALRKEMEESREIEQAKIESLQSQLNKTRAEEQKKVQSLQSELNKSRARMSVMETNVEKLRTTSENERGLSNAQIAELKKKLSEAKAESQTLQDEMKKKKEERTKASEELKTLQSELDELKKSEAEKLSTLQKKLGDSETTIEDLEDEIEELKNRAAEMVKSPDVGTQPIIVPDRNLVSPGRPSRPSIGGARPISDILGPSRPTRPASVPPPTDGYVDNGLGFCKSGQIFSSHAWALLNPGEPRKFASSFDDPLYKDYAKRGQAKCDADPNCKFVTVWRDAGYRMYNTEAGECSDKHDTSGNNKSWKKMGKGNPFVPPPSSCKYEPFNPNKNYPGTHPDNYVKFCNDLTSGDCARELCMNTDAKNACKGECQAVMARPPPSSSPPPTDGYVDNGRGFCKSGQIFASGAWELLKPGEPKKEAPSFDDPLYKDYAKRGQNICDADPNCKYVTVWRNAGYRTYNTGAGECSDKHDPSGSNKSWKKMGKGGGYKPPPPKPNPYFDKNADFVFRGNYQHNTMGTGWVYSQKFLTGPNIVEDCKKICNDYKGGLGCPGFYIESRTKPEPRFEGRPPPYGMCQFYKAVEGPGTLPTIRDQCRKTPWEQNPFDGKGRCSAKERNSAPHGLARGLYWRKMGASDRGASISAAAAEGRQLDAEAARRRAASAPAPARAPAPTRAPAPAPARAPVDPWEGKRFHEDLCDKVDPSLEGHKMFGPGTGIQKGTRLAQRANGGWKQLGMCMPDPKNPSAGKFLEVKMLPPTVKNSGLKIINGERMVGKCPLAMRFEKSCTQECEYSSHPASLTPKAWHGWSVERDGYGREMIGTVVTKHQVKYPAIGAGVRKCCQKLGCPSDCKDPKVGGTLYRYKTKITQHNDNKGIWDLFKGKYTLKKETGAKACKNGGYI